MAFELPGMPNFNPQIPQQPDFLSKLAAVTSLKNMMGQQQLLPMEVQEARARAQQADIQTTMQQNQLASQQAMIKAWSDPDFLKSITSGDAADSSGMGFDPDAMTKQLISKGVLPQDAIKMTQSFVDRSAKIADIHKANAQAGEAESAQFTKAHEELANRLSPILDMKPAEAQQALDRLKYSLLKNPIPGLDRQDAALVNSADLAHLPAMVNMLGLDASISKYHQQKASESKAEQGVIPQGGGLSPEAQQDVQKSIATETNPQVVATKEAIARAEGEARGAIEVQVQNALKKQGNAALANVPPGLAQSATADYTKASLDYAQAQSVSQRLQQMMQAAKGGNVVSYQLIPQEGALQVTTSQGVHRINMTEIEQYGGGGSLFQRMEGHFGKALTGKSIPDSVLNDMADMQKIQEEGAQSKYENSVKAINTSYGSTFKTVDMPTAGEKQPVNLPIVTFKGITYTPDQLKSAGYTFNESKHQWEKGKGK